LTPRNRGTLAALAVIAVGVAGTIVDPNGVVGVILFGAAAAAVLYLIARPVARRLRLPSPTRVPPLLRWRTLAIMAVAAGALLGATNLFDGNSDAAVGRILNDATFLGGFALLAALALVALGTAVRWALSAVTT
jgi:hypothetical protein